MPKSFQKNKTQPVVEFQTPKFFNQRTVILKNRGFRPKTRFTQHKG